MLEFLDPIGLMSIEMLSIGVVTMFISAGILIHSVYLIEYDNFVAVPIFWTSVLVTCTTMLCMKISEDRKEKKKEGVYDVSWQDESTISSGPFAKIDKAAEELSNDATVSLSSLERVISFGRREKIERDVCPKTQLLRSQVEYLRKESDKRAKRRDEVLQLLTTATEELDSLPEELIARTNKILHSTDEADICNANIVTVQKEGQNTPQEVEKYLRGPSRVFNHKSLLTSNGKIGIHPIDAQRLPLSLVSLRKKLGEISHTTLLRLKNTSNEPLRLKSGVQLKDGNYVKSLYANDPYGNQHCFHLYPGTEIPPRTEVIVVARSRGGWFPTSGITGKVVYTNIDESWTFEVSFRNDLIGNVRRCHVKAYPTDNMGEKPIVLYEKNKQYWQISKDEYDAKANNEIMISFDALHGESTKASCLQRQSTLTLKNGILKKKGRLGLGSQWQELWCVLTPVEIVFSKDAISEKQEKISLQFITEVRADIDQARDNVFEIHTSLGQHCLSAKSQKERNNWIKSITDAVDLIPRSRNEIYTIESQVNNSKISPPTNTVVNRSSDMHLVLCQSHLEDSVECVHKETKTEILSV